jgi:glycosyltransferase involved in cell wall biosynthesis
MAHNEEKVIQRAVESVLEQKIPVGYSIKVVVVANGCSDRTGEIVKFLEQQHPRKVVFLSIQEKGKTRAINRAIAYFDELSKNNVLIPYVVFLDADCELNGKEALINFVSRFKEAPKLCAIGADCVPDVFYNDRKDVTAEIYRAVYGLGKFVRINSISGMCYGIRLDVLKMIDFPEFQFAEDMFISARLSGWFYKDRGIQIVFKTPSDLGSEIKRRTRQEISTQRYHRYYSYLKEKGVKVKLFEKPLGEDYRWWGATDNDIVKKWFKMEGLKPKVLSAIYILIKGWARVKAHIITKGKGKDQNTDYWKVIR